MTYETPTVLHTIVFSYRDDPCFMSCQTEEDHQVLTIKIFGNDSDFSLAVNQLQKDTQLQNLFLWIKI